MVDRINDLSRKQIVEYLKKSQPSERNCLWCGKSFLMKPNQQFCSAKCRANRANAVNKLELQSLQNDLRDLLAERESLIRENVMLRAKLKSYGFPD